MFVSSKTLGPLLFFVHLDLVSILHYQTLVFHASLSMMLNHTFLINLIGHQTYVYCFASITDEEYSTPLCLTYIIVLNAIALPTAILGGRFEPLLYSFLTLPPRCNIQLSHKTNYIVGT